MIGSDASRPPMPVTLENWQSASQLRWTFRHMAEIFPTATIRRGSGPVWRLPSRAEDLTSITLTDYAGNSRTVQEVIDYTDTDAWMVVHDGTVLTERYAEGMTAATPHLLMSVSKSLVGMAVGVLVDHRLLDVDKTVSYYVPALADSGYANATLRHVLDMRSGIRFSEEYLNPDAEVRVLEQAFGWAPRRHDHVPTSMRGFLQSLRQERPHGGAFDYRSCESDVLGWVCEVAAGRWFPDLLSELIWSKMGVEFDANIGVDSKGTGMFDGGISAALGDMARFGQMVLHDGAAFDGALQVVSSAWVADTRRGGPDSREAFEHSPGDNRMPGGMYRNQFWLPYPGDNILLCLGIHGQMVYVNRSARVVAVKLSSWPTPQDAWRLFSTVSAFDAIARAVS